MTSKQFLATTFLLIAILLLVACDQSGDKQDKTVATTQDAGKSATEGEAGTAMTAAPANNCKINISGDESISYVREGDSSSVSTEYWMSEDEIKRAVEIMTKVTNADLSEEALARKTELAMQKDPKRELLRINCSSTDQPRKTISIWASNSSKYSDIGFKPGTYPIPAQKTPGQDVKAGELSAIVRLGSVMYAITESGTMNISRFDTSGISGTFSIKATESGPITRTEGNNRKNITIAGEFDYACTMRTSVCQGR